MGRNGAFLLAAAVLILASSQAQAQQVHTGTPFHSGSDSFYENIGSSWGFNWRGATVNFGNGSAQTQPRFGGFQPGADATLGFNVRGAGFNGFFNGFASQGSARGFSSVSPSVTTMNGQPGMFSDTSQSPFVIGVVPTVGGAPIVVGIPQVPMFMPGTTVQLPTWSMFGVNTSVSVPDGGGALLGGVDRAADGRKEFGAPGLPSNRAIGSNRSAANVSVHATIHDLAEMDRQILAGRPAGVAAATPPPSTADGSSASQAAPSVAAAQRLHEAEHAVQDEELTALLERAQSAEADGKLGAARVYYQMIANKATGDLKATAMERLQTLRKTGSSGTVAGAQP